MARPLGARNKDKPLSDALRMMLAEVDDDTGLRKARRVADALYSAAIEGEVPAIKEIFDRLEGKPSQAIDVDVAIGPTQAFLELLGRISDGEFSKPMKVIDGMAGSMAAEQGQPAAVRDARSQGRTIAKAD